MATPSPMDGGAASEPSCPRGQLLDLNAIVTHEWNNTRAPHIDTEVLETIIIARAVFCCNELPGCPTPTTEAHLVIHFEHVPIGHTSAVAISYAWGEFDRRKVVIGHRLPHSGSSDPICLELGIEWNTPDLQNCLVRLSETHGGIWMDQLCMGQEQETIRRTLASIPTIYRSLDVVALMAGLPCLQKCMGESVHAFESESMTHDEINERYSQTIQTAECVNWRGMDSWFDRLWTRQELMYSQRITVLRCSQSTVPCVTREEDADQLQGFAKLKYERDIRAGYSARDAFRALRIANMRYSQNAMSSMTAYCRYGNPDYNNQVNAVVMLSRFLRGETIENPQLQVSRGDVNGRLKSFMYQLGRLGRSKRQATQQRDYVLAVWVDCPGYKAPEGFKGMSLPVLLEDAICQLERNFGISPTSSAPAGLFGNREGGGLWRPTTYLPESVHNTQEIYSVVRDHHVPVFEQSIPLMSLGMNSLSISSRAAPYSHLFAESSTADVFARLRPVVAQFSLESLSRIVGTEVTEDGSVRETEPDSLLDKMFHGYLLGPDVPYKPAGLTYPSEWTFPEARHHDMVYRIVSSALSLPVDACRDAQLELMVSLEYPPCIGLFLPSASHACQRAPPNLDERVRTSHIHGHQFATLCTTRDHSEMGCSLLEAAFVKTGPPAVLEVVGIWVPIKYTSLDDVQALALPFGRDARLGGPQAFEQHLTGDELLAYLIHQRPQSLAAEMRLRDGGGDANVPTDQPGTDAGGNATRQRGREDLGSRKCHQYCSVS